MTALSPSTATLKDCRYCATPPQIFRAENNGDKWAIVCPGCGHQLVGRRVEGFDLAGTDIVHVTKHGDDFDRMVEMWNNSEVGQ